MTDTSATFSEQRSAGPIPRAKLVRDTLKAAGLEHLVDRVTSGTKNTHVSLLWRECGHDAAKAEAVAAALRPLWRDGDVRVQVIYNGALLIRRNAWKTLPTN